MDNVELQFLQKEVGELKEEIKELAKRILKIETSREKTEFQYDQIMKSLEELNKVTIPKLMEELENIKNKPAKRWDSVINALISAVVAALVGFGVSKLGGN